MHKLRATLIVLAVMAMAGCAIVPKPIEGPELADYAADKEARVTANQEPLSGPIGLYEAMARALQYNLDHRLEVMEVIVRDQQLRVAHYSKLPGLVAGSGYTGRSNYSGGSSSEILSSRTIGGESLRSSTSSERDVYTGDLQFSWHILDFGLSWIRARQAADRVLVAEEMRRRVVNRIVEDVRTAYWRAVTATRLLARLRRLDGRVDRALSNTQKLVEDKDTSPLTALTYERELVEIQREIRRLNGELSTAKAQLAALMNVDPGDDFDVIIPPSMPQPRLLGQSAPEMIHTALLNRSELRETAYKARVNEDEAAAAILEMLPGVSFTASPNWDSNDFLFNNNWVSWGARASWNLMKVFSYPARRAQVDAQSDLIDQKALAVTMAIMTQVHVSRARLIHARRNFRTAARFNDVQWRIIEQIRQALDAGRVSEQTAIREEMNGLVSRVKLDLAYVELQSAFASAHASMGLAPYDDISSLDLSVATLEGMLRSRWADLGDRFTH